MMMAKVGALGEIVFTTSSKKILSFSDFKRSGGGRWAKHDRINKKPISQFIGPDLDMISFVMHLDIRLGVVPRKQLEKLNMLKEQGKAMPLTIGGKRIGSSYWIIKQIEESWDVIGGHGELLVATANITLQEYVVRT